MVAEVDKRDEAGLRNYALLADGRRTKSTAFDRDERDRLGLRGLLPPRVETQDDHVRRALESVRRKGPDIERYIYLMALQDHNERLFYRLLIDYVDEMLPLVYTPTVGQACKEFGHIYRRPQGIYVTVNDRGRVGEILDNWPERSVKVVVVTDGERILGLGDLGASGMGIPIGKLALYTALAGVHPEECLPIMFDVGTNNEAMRTDSLYLGIDQERVRGEVYDALMQELIEALTEKYPGVLIQFEDFQTATAYRLLSRYRDDVLCFNDDIQGTAAVVLAGVLASCRITNKRFDELKILFLGAGSAATGIADLMVAEFKELGLSEADARKRLLFCNSGGLVQASRDRIAEHVRPYAHDLPPASFAEALETYQPDVLIGATGMPATFTRDVVARMAAFHERPVIFALSNPTERAECTAEQCYEWSDGRAVFASGSPFSPVEVNGTLLRPGQGNNAYVFPGIGLGALACDATKITDPMFLAASDALAGSVSAADLDSGSLYPSMQRIREISLAIASAVAAKAWDDGIARAPRPDEISREIASTMYEPNY